MEFSKEQKDFLKKFVKCDTRMFYNSAESPFWMPNIILDVAEISKIVVKYEDENSSADSRILEVEYDKNNPKYKGIYSIFDWMYFFNYLRDNNYILCLTMGDKQKKGKYHYIREKIPIPNNIDIEIPINNIEIEGLKNWDFELMYPRPLLLELVARDFKTQEEIRFETEMTETKKMFKANMKATKDMFKKNICYTKLMLVVALFSSIVALGISVWDRDKEITPKQHKELLSTIKNTKTDTTQIEIIKPIKINSDTKKTK